MSAWLGSVLGWLVGRLFAVRRVHVVASMRRAGVADVERAANAMYASLGRGLCELLWAGLRPRRGLEARVVLDDAVAQRVAGLAANGAVIATAHTGNWDLLACATAARFPLTVVTKKLSVRALNRLWQSLRARRGIRLVGAGAAAREGLRSLGRGELVAMMIDQAPERVRGTVVTEFLGRPARVDLAPALLALRARVPLITVFSHRLPDGRVAIELASVHLPPRRASRRWAERGMIEATRALAAFVAEHPEQWLWMHRRWKDAPPDNEAVVLRSTADERSAPHAA